MLSGLACNVNPPYVCVFTTHQKIFVKGACFMCLGGLTFSHAVAQCKRSFKEMKMKKEPTDLQVFLMALVVAPVLYALLYIAMAIF